jgi:hypothetical protein
MVCKQEEVARIVYDGPISPVQTLKHARALGQRREQWMSHWLVISIYLHATDCIRKIRESIRWGENSHQTTLPSAVRTPLTSGAP